MKARTPAGTKRLDGKTKLRLPVLQPRIGSTRTSSSSLVAPRILGQQRNPEPVHRKRADRGMSSALARAVFLISKLSFPRRTARARRKAAVDQKLMARELRQPLWRPVLAQIDRRGKQLEVRRPILAHLKRRILEGRGPPGSRGRCPRQADRVAHWSPRSRSSAWGIARDRPRPRRQQGLREVVWHRDPQQPARFRRRRGEFPLAGEQRCRQRLPAVPIVGVPGGRHVHPPRRPLDQRHPQPLLQPRDLRAHRRRRHAELPGRCWKSRPPLPPARKRPRHRDSSVNYAAGCGKIPHHPVLCSKR